MLLGRGQSGDHSEEHAELFRMDPEQAGEGRAENGKAGLQSATVRCLAASITARTTSASRTLQSFHMKMNQLPCKRAYMRK